MTKGITASSLVVATAVLMASPASAEERTSSLGWVRLPGAEACIGPHALALAVERRLGRSVFVSAAKADVVVEGRIERTAGGFHAVVVLSSAAGDVLGSRELTNANESCRAIDEELELVLALPELKSTEGLRKDPAPSPPTR